MLVRLHYSRSFPILTCVKVLASHGGSPSDHFRELTLEHECYQ